MTHITREVERNYSGITKVTVGDNVAKFKLDRIELSVRDKKKFTCVFAQGVGYDANVSRIETDDIKIRIKKNANKQRAISVITSYTRNKLSERVQFDTTGKFQRIFLEGSKIVNSTMIKEYSIKPSQMTGEDRLAVRLTKDVSFVSQEKVDMALSYARELHSMLDGIENLPFQLETLLPEDYVREETKILLDGIASN